MTTKTFSLTAVLTVLTSRMLDAGKWDEAVDLMSHIIGRPIYTHEIPAVISDCADWIETGHKALIPAAKDLKAVPPSEIASWLDVAKTKYGDAFQISSILSAYEKIL